MHPELDGVRYSPAEEAQSSPKQKARILKALGAGLSVRVLVATPSDGEWRGLPVVTFVGLEAGLIKALRPEWNRQGKG